jgi:hypothetical protein
MVSLADYFAANRYKAVYSIGDRVYGKFNKTPFIGSVGNDTVINEEQGPRVSIHLDLPIKVDGEYKSVIIVKHKDIKQILKEY